jgi:type I restriction enzyme S subunit
VSWPLADFSQLATDVSGGNVKTLQSDFLPSGPYPVIDQGQTFIAGYSDDAARLCRTPGPVIVFGDHTKCFKFVDFPFCMGADGTKVLAPKDGVNAKYLFYALQTVHIPEAGYTRHFKYLKAGKLPLPSLPEQRRIAAILDKADALRHLRRQSLARQAELEQAFFREVFGDLVANSKGWEEGRVLGDVADVSSGITKGRKIKGQSTREVPYLAVSNVQDGHVRLDVVKTIEATETEIIRYQLRCGDIVLTEGGDPDKLGRGGIWHGEISDCIHQNHVFRVRTTEPEVRPLFLSRLIGSQRGKRYFLRSAKQTTGIASINMTQLRNFPLLLPPLTVQMKYEEEVERLEQEKKLARRALACAETLFTSLQHRAFRGEL